jgi:hypothetical protein
MNKISIPLTNEESDLLELFKDDKVIVKCELDPREQLLANQLVVKEVLQRVSHDGEVIYKKRIAL